MNEEIGCVPSQSTTCVFVKWDPARQSRGNCFETSTRSTKQISCANQCGCIRPINHEHTTTSMFCEVEGHYKREWERLLYNKMEVLDGKNPWYNPYHNIFTGFTMQTFEILLATRTTRYKIIVALVGIFWLPRQIFTCPWQALSLG